MGATSSQISESEAGPQLDLYTVRTPEMVEFSFQLAGPGSRFLAWLLDMLIIISVLVVLAIVMTLAGMGLAMVGGSLGLIAVALFFIGVFLIRSFYAVYFEMRWNGQTPGKRALGLRVLGESGLRLSLAQSMTRNLLRALDSLPVFCYFVGLVSMLTSRHSQRIGDLLARTIVIREEGRPLPEELKLPQPKYNTLLSDKGFPARCGRVLVPAERELLVEVVQRRDELSLEARSRLFETLAEHFRGRLDMRNEPRFLSDEKWIVNLTQAVLENERRMLAA